MGNYKFRISDMIPNAWFHKLKDMTKPKNKHSSSSITFTKKKPNTSNSLPHHSSPTLVANSPRNSLHARRMSKRKTLYKPFSPSIASSGFNKSKINAQDFSGCLSPTLKTSPDSFMYNFHEEEGHEFVEPSKFKINTKHKVKESDFIEITCSASNLPKNPQKNRLYVKINKGIEEDDDDEYKAEKKYQKKISSGRKSSSAGINLKRVNSPTIQLSSTRRSISRSESKQVVLESFAVIKRSIDPRKDFRESMVEMIEENNIRASKDLEDLLTCYLSLNPKEYHDLIIQVFEQIWLQLTKTK